MSTVMRSATELAEPRPIFRVEPLTGAQERSPHAERDRKLLRYLLILGQLGALIALTYRFQLESESFRRLVVLTAGGFAVHYFLPLGQRLGFFVLLSLAGSASCSAPPRPRG